MNRFRFYITALSSRIEVFPLNHWETALIDERENDGIYYRRKFNGTLQFTDNNGGDDFSLFYLIEVNSPGEQLILEIEEKDSGANTYHEYWVGHFSTTDGEFDLDKCSFQITPKPYDDYRNFDLYGDKEYNIISEIPTTVTTHTNTQTYTRNRWLIDVIEFLVTEIEPAANVESWFFNNANNPVTTLPNQWNLLTIAQKSDIKRPTSSNPATVAMLSFNKLMDMLKMFNVRYRYDGTTFKIEHISYWNSIAGLDLRAQSISAKSNKYSYEKEDMPKYEKFSFMEANNLNFKEHTISYENNIVDPKSTTEYSFGVTTDIEYIEACVADSDLISNISDEGFVILANYIQGADYYVYYGVAFENPFACYNHVCSWSYLLRMFFMHDRVLLNGYINQSAVNFISAKKIKLQNINAIVCYDDNYDPSNYITTELGETYFGGQKGFVKTATISPDGQVAFQLLYGEEESDEDLPAVPKIIHVVVDETSGKIYTYLSEQNIVDTYFWIWWNETTCQEIMIPAGTMYQEDDIDEEDPITNTKFNFSDISVSDWQLIYNDNVEWELCDDLDCGGRVLPAPPAAPVAVQAMQEGNCELIDVFWNVSAGATYYEIYRKPDAGMVDDYGYVGTEIYNHYYDYAGGLEHGVTFSYKIKACNEAGCSGYSNVVSTTSECV